MNDLQLLTWFLCPSGERAGDAEVRPCSWGIRVVRKYLSALFKLAQLRCVAWGLTNRPA